MSPHLADVLFAAAALDYLVATVLFVRFLLAKEPNEKEELFAARLVALGAFFHASHIVAASLVWKVCPVAGVHFPIDSLSRFTSPDHADQAFDIGGVRRGIAIPAYAAVPKDRFCG